MEDAIFIAKAAGFLGAAITMGLGSIAPAYAQGLIAAKGVEAIAKYPESYSNIRTVLFLGLGIVESAAVYALLVSGALIYFSFYL